MIQGKEFTDFEHGLMNYLHEDIRQGGFDKVLGKIGKTRETLNQAISDPELADWDYIDVDGELNTDKIFTDTFIKREVLRTLRIVEVMTVPILLTAQDNRALFMVVGESTTPEAPYICYAYGMIIQAHNEEETYYFRCLTEIRENT